ncbi:hypothetical protein BKA58DRAFT_472387 [Alternaria rosae]|uniref:uncharacterized protein n=1 Tax=Alternaria rosae TaxID=1187941 RepID=UPI001E8D5E46|nr:uncharacterized protein BKA58DRAFT_472387 [Alternaria rosae]KAH6865259.1 hypothetical protein BKA58DRAFT_472387 [Alternaria rosae]
MSKKRSLFVRENPMSSLDLGYQLPEKPSKRGTLCRDGHVFTFKESDIMTRATEYEKYSKGGISLTGLPKFDDLKNYGISSATEKHLWLLEIRRLRADAASEDALIFNSNGIFDRTDSTTFENLSNLADQITCNFSIIVHDNALHILEHCRWIGTLSTAVRNFKGARTRLTTRFEQDEEKVRARRPKLLEDPEANRKVYFALVDYITSHVARLVVRSATSDFWNNHSLAILAKWSAKLKILSYNPAQYSSLSLDAAEDLLARMTDSEAKENLKVLKVRATDVGPESKDDLDIDSQAEADITGYYFQDHNGLQVRLANLFNYAAFALYASEKTGNPPNCFEVCTLVYETGLERSLTVISNDRRGDVAATSDTTHVTCSYTAFQNLMKNVELLKSERQPPRDDTREQTNIRWQWAEGIQGTISPVQNFRTSRFDDIVSIMVPLALTDPHTGIELGNMLDFATGNSEEEDPVIQFERKHFTAKFVVTTAAWQDKQHKLKFANAAHGPDLDVLPVSRSPLSRTIRAGTSFADILNSPLEQTKTDLASSGSIPESPNRSNASKQKSAEIRMNGWIISELTVTLKCYRYVYTILTLCVLLICGATAVPFSVQNRLKGVDPFNITTFAWLLAGFILVVAKSRYVCEWPWHDFLRGRVICKSIKEVAEVTGIDDQLILTSLLHNERDTALITKGPYNGMFERRAESGNEGFSIDVPCQLSTMLASGFIVLKVLSSKGERLICLDVRKGSEWESGAAMRHAHLEYLTCMDLEDKSDVEEEAQQHLDGTGRKKILRLSRVYFMWTRVLGVYIKDSLFG